MKKSLLTLAIALLLCSCTTALYAVTPTYVYYGWVERGGCQVATGLLRSTTKVQCSYPGAQIDVYTDVNGTIHDTIYSTDSGTPLSNPFFANSDGSFTFYSNSLVSYVKGTGGGLPAPFQRTFYGTTAPTVTYITQAGADARYLRLIGGVLAGPGNLTVGGALSVTGIAGIGGQLTTNGIFDTGGGIVTRDGIGGVVVSPSSGTNASFWATLPSGQLWHFGMEGGNNFIIANTTDGTVPITIDGSTSLTTIANGLTVTGGTLTAGPVSATTIAGTTGTFGGTVSGAAASFSSVASSGAVSGTTGTFTGNLSTTANAGIGQAAGGTRLTVGAGGGGAQAEALAIDAGLTGAPSLALRKNGASKSFLVDSIGGSTVLAGDANGDVCLVGDQRLILNNGTNTVRQAIFLSTGLALNYAGSTPADPSFPLHVRSTTTPQFVTEYDATHRTGLWHDATNGYVGTTTNTPFTLRTNNTDALSITNAQNANFAGAVGLNDPTATYPLSLKKTGAVCATAQRCSVSILDTTGGYGLALGYDTVNNSGVIVGNNVASATIDFYARGVSPAYSKVMSVASAGLIVNSFSSIGGSTTAGSIGVPVPVGSVVLTSQSAGVGPTTIFATANGNNYRVCWEQNITRAATTSSSLTTTISYNNGAAKTSTYWVDAAAGTTGTTADTSNTLGSERGNCFTFLSGVGNLQYTTAYSTTGATTMQYFLKVYVEKIE